MTRMEEPWIIRKQRPFHKNHRTTHVLHKPNIKRTNRHPILYIPRKVASIGNVIDRLNRQHLRPGEGYGYYNFYPTKNNKYTHITVGDGTYRINGETLYNAYVDYLIKKAKKTNKTSKFDWWDKDILVGFTIIGYKTRNRSNSSHKYEAFYILKNGKYIRDDGYLDKPVSALDNITFKYSAR